MSIMFIHLDHFRASGAICPHYDGVLAMIRAEEMESDAGLKMA
jgi:hypothetical protein